MTAPERAVREEVLLSPNCAYTVEQLLKRSNGAMFVTDCTSVVVCLSSNVSITEFNQIREKKKKHAITTLV